MTLSRHRIASIPASAPRARPLLALAVGAGLLLGSVASVKSETPREYCERQAGSARIVCLRDLGNEPAATSAPAASPAPAPAASPAPAPAAVPAAAAKPPAAETAQPAAATAPAGDAPYKVVDGNKVDANTLEGFRTWRIAACDRCHGAAQEGAVGPSLIASLKTLSRDQFHDVVLNGRLERGMPSFNGSDKVKSHIDDLYSYLKGRSDGAITSVNVTKMD